MLRLRDKLKAIKITFSVTILVAVFLSIGLVSAAITSNDVTISAYLSNSSLRPGDQIVVNVTFDSKVAQALDIYAIGIHADWMQAEQLQGPNYASSETGPVTVEANGLFSTRFVATVPVGTSLGAHTYYIGVDGLDSSNVPFSLNSAESTLQVVSSTSSTTPTPTSTQDGGLGDISDWLPFIVVGVVAAVMALLVILTMLRGRKKKEPSKSQDETNYNQPAPTPEPETEQEPKSKEDNFSI
jgi:hypothetical protein